MINEINKIKDAERRSSEKCESAKKEAAEIILQAENLKKGIIKDALADAEKKYKNIIDQSTENATSEAKTVIENGIKYAQKMKITAENHIESASLIIINHIIGDV
jgi:vacuolar-type H+-ATPase subunit H